MTGAREVGGASVAARRLLVLAGAVAGLWLVFWLTSDRADAAAVVSGAGDAVAGAVGSDSPVPHAVGRVVAAGSRGVATTAKAAAFPVATGSGAAAGGAPSAGPRARVVASPVTTGATVAAGTAGRAVGAAVSPAPVAGAVGTVGEAARTVAPIARGVGAAVSPISGSELVAPVSRVVAGVVRPVVPVLAPVTAVAKSLLSPVTGAAAPVLEPIVSALPSDLAKPVTSPVVNEPTGKTVPPVGAPGAVEPPTSGSVVREVIVRGRPAAIGAPPDQARRSVLAPAKAAQRARPCAARVVVKPHRSAASHDGTHRPGNSPAHPSSPVTSSEATAAGAGIPLGFLTGGPAPHRFRASPGAHGDFVPLWRPCKPGTGPG